MKNWKTLSALVLSVSLASCATTEPVPFSEFEKQNAYLLREEIPLPSRIDYPLKDLTDIKCGEDVCTMPKASANQLLHDTEKQQDIIHNLNKEIESQVKAHNATIRQNNSLVNALTECEYGRSKRDEAIESLEKKNRWDNALGIVKQIGLAAVCGVLLY